jgi:DNA-binding CsgD family transcriptional regulator
MFTCAAALALGENQRHQLEFRARAGTTPQKVARKREAILLASHGVSNRSIARQTGLSRPTVLAARAAFAREGIESLGRPSGNFPGPL